MNKVYTGKTKDEIWELIESECFGMNGEEEDGK